MSQSRKGSREDQHRYSHPSKRKFRGNQYTKKDDASVGESASSKKLHTTQSEDIPIHQEHCYRIIDFVTVFTVISSLVLCKNCKQQVSFTQSQNRGVGFKILLSCRCGRKDIPSSPFINNAYEINRRLVFVMRLLGISLQGINLFCNLMDLGEGLSNNAYYLILQHVYDAAKVTFLTLRKKAVKEEQLENEKHERPLNNFKISGDGSWKKRGFSSLFGVTTFIAYYSGKVIDFVVKSLYCHRCAICKKKRAQKNFCNGKKNTKMNAA